MEPLGEPVQEADLAENNLFFPFIGLFLTHLSSLILIAAGEDPNRNTYEAHSVSPLRGVNAVLMY